MSWGSPFRNAWDAASSGARAAAREAVISPEKAAGLLADTLAHTLQRTQYAARDVRRLQQATQAAETPDAAAAQAAALRSAMDDIRAGKVPPERAEKHVQQALRPATGKVAVPDGERHSDGRHAAQRFVELRKRLLEQLDEAQERWTVNNVPADAAFVQALDRAFALVDELFLEGKRADDPAAPLPSGPGPGPAKEDA
ncbi:hypothetical protein [Noviherbaspirillum sp.]|uniref:hypothetical protein n=1 Tax=Noviherbaspirillum sp. TaxID=1926288 RepID=UPI002D5D75BF|nr:hypothetical protein [Noviherbaspirillum sp.]HZW19955.1 hypothetical protein [Noviherbaspirillum sp.]